MAESKTTADIAWIRLVQAARDWAKHMDQWERFKFPTEYGPVYVSIDRSVPYPDSFDMVDTLTEPQTTKAWVLEQIEQLDAMHLEERTEFRRGELSAYLAVLRHMERADAKSNV